MNPPTNSSQSDTQHKHFQELYTHQFCCRFSQNIANLFPSNNFVIKRCLYYKIHILSITVDLSIMWGILKIYPNSNLTKKLSVTSPLQNIEIVRYWVAVFPQKNIKNFAYGDALYMTHYLYSSEGGSFQFNHFLNLIESIFNFLTTTTLHINRPPGPYRSTTLLNRSQFSIYNLFMIKYI